MGYSFNPIPDPEPDITFTSNNWKVTEKSDVHFCLEDPHGYWRVYQKWDGCLELTRSMNAPIAEATPDDIDKMHICDLSALMMRLSELAFATQLLLPNTDASDAAVKVIGKVVRLDPKGNQP